VKPKVHLAKIAVHALDWQKVLRGFSVRLATNSRVMSRSFYVAVCPQLQLWHLHSLVFPNWRHSFTSAVEVTPDVSRRRSPSRRNILAFE
jgi:hypothetical protein